MQCHRVESYIEGEPILRKKKSFSTLDDAIKFAKKVNCNDNLIHKVVAYKCKECFQYHIGKGNKILTDKERNKYKSLV